MDRLLTTAEVAELVGWAPKTLRNKRHLGGGPPAVKLSPGRSGSVGYRPADVERWLAERRQARTHEAVS